MTRLPDFTVTATLNNGVTVTIRALRPDDRERIATAIRHLDRESIYRRLFSYRSELTEAGLDRIMAVDPARDVALVVTTGAGADEEVVAAGRYMATGAEDGERTAEVAFMVDERYRGQGLAGRVLGHLAAFARQNGFTRLEADVLAGNGAMLSVFARSGLPMRTRNDGSTVHVALALAGGRT
ncbi:MAG: GNAT family N-acetyltransferase [Burkholderiales bacterium]